MTEILKQLRHIARRRRVLRDRIDYATSFEGWAESCVPSYCHPHPAAAATSWLRLLRAASLAKRYGVERPRVLDFGASVGELAHLIDDDAASYDFIEQSDQSAAILLGGYPAARRTVLSESGKYDWIFALDSLEHNEDFASLLEALARRLSEDGILVLSGPTENLPYRIGRRFAGFQGGYHKTSIYEIEAAAEKYLRRLKVVRIYPGVSLFRLSVWTRKASGGPADDLLPDRTCGYLQ